MLPRRCVLCRRGLYQDSPEMMQMVLQRSLLPDAVGPPPALHMDMRSPAPVLTTQQPPPAHRSPGRHAALGVTRPLPAHFHPLPIYSPS